MVTASLLPGEVGAIWLIGINRVVRKLQFLNNFPIKIAVLQAESRQTEGRRSKNRR